MRPPRQEDMQKRVHLVTMMAATTANRVTKLREANNQQSGGDDNNSKRDREGDKGDKSGCNKQE
jgi:hypothetical protein